LPVKGLEMFLGLEFNQQFLRGAAALQTASSETAVFALNSENCLSGLFLLDIRELDHPPRFVAPCFFAHQADTLNRGPDSKPHHAIQPVIVWMVRPHFPFVDGSPPPVGLDAVLPSEMIREQPVLGRRVPEQR